MSETTSCSNAQSFVPHDTKANDAKSVWSHYLVARDKSEVVKCKKCNKILQTKGGSTKGLHTHLKTHNSNIVPKRDERDESPEHVPCNEHVPCFFCLMLFY
ncbi:uncharacterized protein LOC118745623 [Rhagoletis pomonella]|uniref:uncharacterized protein LOC118745623 n=1 Tax=Rhagoletis pomonella TaxID=28610 RepID=UPI001782D769|nr:uncharacterized protein LOC118745623 [Rhagoletis pomonella]